MSKLITNSIENLQGKTPIIPIDNTGTGFSSNNLVDLIQEIDENLQSLNSDTTNYVESATLLSILPSSLQNGAVIRAASLSTVGDNGGGTFDYVSTSLASPDGFSVYLPAGVLSSEQGRYIRRISKNEKVSVLWYHPKPTSDWGPAIKAVAATGRGFLPKDGGPYPVASKVDLLGSLTSDGATITTTLTTLMFEVFGTSSELSGFTILGNHSSTAYYINASSGNCSSPKIDVTISIGNSGISCSATDANIKLVASALRGVGVKLYGSASGCNVEVLGKNVTTYNVYLTDTCNNNFVSSDHRAEPSSFTSWQLTNVPGAAFGKMGQQCILEDFQCYSNYIQFGKSINSTTASFTLSGNKTVVNSLVSTGSLGNGLTLHGESCFIDELVVEQGVNALELIALNGNVCQYNQVSFLSSVNNSSYGVLNNTEGYREWVSGAVYPTAVTYCVYGLNLYSTTAATTTFGTTAPVHTSGVVNDGVSNWTYVKSFDLIADSNKNNIVSLICKNNGLGDYLNNSKGSLTVSNYSSKAPAANYDVFKGQIPNGQPNSGVPKGTGSVDLQSLRTLASQVPSGNYSLTGGSNNTVSGQYSASYGDANSTSGSYSFTFGKNLQSTADYSTVSGLNTIGNKYGSRVHSTFNFRNTAGTAQSINLIFGGSTTDNTATVLTLNNVLPVTDTTFQWTINPNGCVSGRLEIQALQVGGTAGSIGDSAFWSFPVHISRVGSSSPVITGIVGSETSTLGIGASTDWTVSLSSSSDVLNISCVGGVDKTIEWIATFTGIEKLS